MTNKKTKRKTKTVMTMITMRTMRTPNFWQLRTTNLTFIVTLQSYMIIVADAADIVCGSKIFMWNNFAQHNKFCWSCGSKLLHMTSSFAPPDTIVRHVEQSYHVKQNIMFAFN